MASSPLPSRGSPIKGDEIKIGYLTPAFSGAHRQSGHITPAFPWVPNKTGQNQNIPLDRGRKNSRGWGTVKTFPWRAPGALRLYHSERPCQDRHQMRSRGSHRSVLLPLNNRITGIPSEALYAACHGVWEIALGGGQHRHEDMSGSHYPQQHICPLLRKRIVDEGLGRGGIPTGRECGGILRTSPVQVVQSTRAGSMPECLVPETTQSRQQGMPEALTLLHYPWAQRARTAGFGTTGRAGLGDWRQSPAILLRSWQLAA